MRVVVIGLGKMGRALAERFLDQGDEVAVWNRTSAAAADLVGRGAVALASPGAAWTRADVAFSFLANDGAVEEVCLGGEGLVASAPAGALLVEMSTISVSVSARVAAAAALAGLRYLRAPVSGNPAVLAAGRLALIVSGDRSAYDDVFELLSRIGSAVHYVGDAEQARIAKLAVNAVLAGTAQLLAEALTVSEAAGIERASILDILSGSAVGSPFIAYKRAALLARRYEATFTLAMLVKDLNLALDVSRDLRLQLPVTELVAELAASSCDEGMADLDFMALLPHLQASAGRPTDVAVDRLTGTGSPRRATLDP
jgi:3-hydroxyisobutyrate dehydrogenase-like beta-hydroxyacid dehydrogenase